MNLGITGKVAMVGGASRGLGFAVARALAREGALLSIVSRDRDGICGASSRLETETGVRPLALSADLHHAEDIARWHAATLQHFGGVDLLFTNTGGPPAGPVLGFDDCQWRAAFELLVMSAVRLVRLVVPSMQARGGGSILMATSSSVKEPIPNLALSNVLRPAVSGLAKTLASELAASKIRVNQIIPGRIDTDRVRQLDVANGQRNGITAEQQLSRSVAAIPAGRYGTPDEFAAMAVFLLSSAASYVTGATVQVDGGLIRGVL